MISYRKLTIGWNAEKNKLGSAHTVRIEFKSRLFKPSEFRKIQPFQSTTLRLMTAGALFYVLDHTSHSNLQINNMSEAASTFYQRFRSRLVDHRNPLRSENWIRLVSSEIILDGQLGHGRRDLGNWITLDKI